MGKSKKRVAQEKQIRELLTKQPKFLKETLCLLYEFQTIDEKVDEYTKHTNMVGFNKPDSTKLSPIADKFQKNRRLTGEEWNDARDRMMKYAGQLSNRPETWWIIEKKFPINANILKETDKALMLEVNATPNRPKLFDVTGKRRYRDPVIKQKWIPKSTIHSEFDPEEYGEQEFVLDNWVIRKTLELKPSFCTYAIRGKDPT